MQIYIDRNGQQMGPYTWEEVQSYLAQGALLPTDTAWYEGLESWVPLSQLVPQQETPVPAAPAPVEAAVVPGQVATEATVPTQGGGKEKFLDCQSGAKKWEFATRVPVLSSPAIGSDGTLYIGTLDKKIYAFKTESPSPAQSPWPMRGQNAQHTGRGMAHKPSPHFLARLLSRIKNL